MPDTPDPVPDEQDSPQPAPADETPAQLLDRLRKELVQQDDELKEQESTLGGLTKQRDNLKAQIETLSKTVDDIKASAAGYGQAKPGLDAERAKLFTHYEDEVKGVEANLGARKQMVLDEVGKVDSAISTQRKTVGDAQKRADAAAGAAAEAKAKAAQKQKEYDDLKSLHKRLGENIKKLKELEDRAESYDRQTKPASEYVILHEQKTLFAATVIPTAEEYAKKLDAAAKELDAARVAEREKKQAAEAAAAELKSEQDKLKKLEESRVADILAAVEKLNVKLPAGEII